MNRVLVWGVAAAALVALLLTLAGERGMLGNSPNSPKQAVEIGGFLGGVLVRKLPVLVPSRRFQEVGLLPLQLFDHVLIAAHHLDGNARP